MSARSEYGDAADSRGRTKRAARIVWNWHIGLVPNRVRSNRVRALIRIEGDVAALHVEVQQTTIADVLSALESFNIRYRSSIALNDVVNGTYAGPPGRVLSRLLVGYNYAIKQGDAEIDVIIVSRYGEQAIPAPIIVQRRGSGE
jgi:hypothetical protein